MDRKSWPWRRKSSEKNLTAEVAAPVQVDNQRNYDDGLSKLLAEHTRMSEEAMARWHQAEDKNKILNEKLSASISELASKEMAVKQHAKVAEEAVTGWEKAEAEAAAFKQQLETLADRSSLLEDRVAQLDIALKERTRQLRLTKEDSDKKIQDLVAQHKKEMEGFRSGYEIKLAEVERSLIEATAENKVMMMSLQEHARTISDISDARSQFEAETHVLRLRLDATDKENSSLKYEIQVLNKELQIRNEEREYAKRAEEASHRLHAEDAKKIAKLESECQKLRVWVRRKLPGPAALAQMKGEVEFLGRESIDSKRRMLFNKPSPVFASPSIEAGHYKLQNGCKEPDVLFERLQAMEEETKMLKEVLSQRNGELHAARLLCARTASKLSAVESQMEHATRAHGNTKSRGLDVHNESPKTRRSMSTLSVSEFSVNDDEVSCSDAWASALISELAHFKREKLPTTPKKIVGSPTLSMMDDFVEMEQLASMSEKTESETPRSEESKIRLQPLGTASQSLEESLERKEKELQAANQSCVEVSQKLLSTEKELMILRAKVAANESSLIGLRESLGKVFNTKIEDAQFERFLEEAKTAFSQNLITDMCILEKDNIDDNSQIKLCSSDIQIEMRKAGTYDDLSDTSPRETDPHPHSDVRHNMDCSPAFKELVLKVVLLTETLAKSIGMQGGTNMNNVFHESETDEIDRASRPAPNLQWENPLFDSGIQKLIIVSNELMQNRSTILQFLDELSCVLNVIIGVVSDMEASVIKSRKQSTEQERTIAVEEHASSQRSQDLNSGTAEHTQSHSESCRQSCPAAECATQTDDALPNLEVELQLLRIEKTALESHLKAELGKVSDLQKQILQQRNEKSDIEHALKLTTQKVEQLTSELDSANQLVCELQMELESKQLMQDERATPSSPTAELDSQGGHSTNQNHVTLVGSLERELEEDHRQQQVPDFKDVNHTLDRIEDSTEMTAKVLEHTEEAQTLKKDEVAAAAERLAECQKNITALEKQLKTIALPQRMHKNELDLMKDTTQEIQLEEKVNISISAAMNERNHHSNHISERSLEFLLSPNMRQIRNSFPGASYGKQTDYDNGEASAYFPASDRKCANDRKCHQEVDEKPSATSLSDLTEDSFALVVPSKKKGSTSKAAKSGSKHSGLTRFFFGSKCNN